MKYLNGEDVLVIHSQIIDETGGLHGIRDSGLFVSIIEKPKTGFDGKDLYDNVFQKAAVYLEAFVKYHVFLDGNKRTAIAATARFLFLNDHDLMATNNEIEEFVLSVVVKKLSIDIITDWLKRHSRKI